MRSSVIEISQSRRTGEILLLRVPFGLTNREDNHDEDCQGALLPARLDAHDSYTKCLYKYSEGEYSYADLVAANRRPCRKESESELNGHSCFQWVPCTR
jgi:hypothetical protein